MFIITNFNLRLRYKKYFVVVFHSLLMYNNYMILYISSDEHLPYARLTCIRLFIFLREVYVMWNMIWPILIVVANTIYNISAKSTPQNINSFASLSVSYLIATICSIIMYFFTSEKKNFLLELSKTNWTTYALGVAIVGLEFGFLCVYRAGWKISLASLFASITLACVLLIVGFFLYKEALSFRQILGMGVCAFGLILIAK